MSQSASTASASHQINFQELWAKYEDIAIHFNDLLMRLRSQSLAAIAAISTLVGIFTRTDVPNVHLEWLVATFILGALTFFWAAIACLDLLYTTGCSWGLWLHWSISKTTTKY